MELFGWVNQLVICLSQSVQFSIIITCILQSSCGQPVHVFVPGKWKLLAIDFLIGMNLFLLKI